MSWTSIKLLSKTDLTFKEAKVKCLSDELASKANREHVGQTSSDVNSDGAVEKNRIHQGKRSFIIEKNVQTFKRMFKKSDNSLS